MTLAGPVSTGPASLGAERRLPDKAAFDRVFEAPDLRLRRHPFSLFARHNATGPARLGLVVGKRHARRAVDRNRLRRIVREHFRVALIARCDIIVLARPGAANVDAFDLHAAARWLFAQTSQRIAEAPPC